MKIISFKCLATALCWSLFSALPNCNAGEAISKTPVNIRPENVMSSIDMTAMKRTVSTLQKLNKNLIIENSRGESDITLY
jgi:hypothetical protein